MTFQRTLPLNFLLGQGHVPHSTTPLPPGKVCLWCIFFALLVMNGPLPAELKFGKNTGLALSGLPSLCLEKRFCFWWYYKSSINQACSVNMDECLPVLTSSYPQKSGKKELGYYPALLFVSCFFSGYLLLPSDISFLLHKIMYM